MKKVFMSAAVLAMAAIMASCGGNASNNNDQKCKESCDTTKCEKVCDAAKCETSACGETKAATPAGGESASAAIDLSKKFICPSRCESQDAAGECSQCGMELVENN